MNLPPSNPSRDWVYIDGCTCFRCEQHRAYNGITVINPFAKTWPKHRWQRQHKGRRHEPRN